MGIELVEPSDGTVGDAGSRSGPDLVAVRTRPMPRVVAGLGLVALLVVAVWLSRPQPAAESGDGSPASTAPTPTTSSTPLAGADGGSAAGPSVVDFEASAMPEPPRVFVAAGDEELALWSVDLATGQAESIPVPWLGAAAARPAVLDLRFFGTDRGVAVDADGRYHLLSFDGMIARRERLVDLGTRTTYGVTGLTQEGGHAWVGIPTGLIRWRLTDDEVDVRWIDAFGDRTSLPEVRLVAEQGLVVEGSGRNFLVDDDGSVRALDLSGEVITGAADWVVSRACDEAMQCGQLTLADLVTGESVTLDRQYRFRPRCGLATPGVTPGVAHLVAEYLGRLVLLTVGTEAPIVERELHPAGIGCVDAVALDADRIVLAHRQAITLITPDDVELIHLDGLGPIVAVGAAPEGG